MALHALQEHASWARSAWVGKGADLNGLPPERGGTFRVPPGAVSRSGDGPQVSDEPYWFRFPLSTPVLARGLRAWLTRAFVLYEQPAGATLAALEVHDGPDLVAVLPGGGGSEPVEGT